MDKMKILFLNAYTFDNKGGIEKFNKLFCKALNESTENYTVFSLYDKTCDGRYVNCKNYKNFNGNKLKFLKEIIKTVDKHTIVFWGHINLTRILPIVKLFKRCKKHILITYGIDIWFKLSLLKKIGLRFIDTIFSISNYTKDRLKKIHNINESKIKLFPCCIDPYYISKENFGNRYPKGNIILTVSRLTKNDRYKGIDKVIESMPVILQEIPNVYYYVVGKIDDYQYYKNLVEKLGMEDKVVFTDYVKDVKPYMEHCDVFVMPSSREGFGIVFLEALACGKPVIAGNKDGSTDALLDGELGILVDPDNVNGIAEAIIKMFKKEIPKKLLDSEYLSGRISEIYGFDKFKKRLNLFIDEVRNELS